MLGKQTRPRVDKLGPGYLRPDVIDGGPSRAHRREQAHELFAVQVAAVSELFMDYLDLRSENVRPVADVVAAALKRVVWPGERHQRRAKSRQVVLEPCIDVSHPRR